MDASIACARAGVTTGEWGAILRSVYGEYRAPTGVTLVATDGGAPGIEDLRARVRLLAARLGEPPRLLMGKPGLDGHSNGAEQIATRAADTGLEVIYDGIRMSPDQLIARIVETKAHLVGLSILSGSHVPLVRDVMNRMRSAGLAGIPVVAGGIIPAEDIHILKQLGVAAVYTPKDFELNRIVSDLIGMIEASAAKAGAARGS